jgi:uncharacterized protein YkwD
VHAVLSLLKALVGFVVVFVTTVIPVSQLAHHPARPSTPHNVVAVPTVAALSGKPLLLRPDGGCILRCEPPFDALPAESSDGQAPAEAPAAAPAVAAPVTVAAPAPPAPRPPAPRPVPQVVIGSTQQALINGDRAAAGLQPLNWSSCLAGIAASWASYMARTGVFQHGPGVNQDFGCGLGSSRTGENIAWMTGGINDAQANTMFMNSPEHRANIMGSYRYVGTAWAVANGKAYVVVEFA